MDQYVNPKPNNDVFQDCYAKSMHIRCRNGKNCIPLHKCWEKSTCIQYIKNQQKQKQK